jgi:hypothetical protein
MTEADFSNKNLGMGGAIIISAWITHKDKGAMTRLVLSNNQLACKAGGETIADMLKGNSVLTELDVSKNIGFTGCDPVEFAQALSPGIGNGAMTKFDISNCSLGAEGVKHIAGALKVSKYMLAVSLVPPSCPSDHYCHCWCLLLSAGHEGDGQPQSFEELDQS